MIKETPSFAAASSPLERKMFIRKLEKHKDKYLIFDSNVFLSYADLMNPENNSYAINQDLSGIGYFDDTNLLSYQYVCDSTVLYTIQNVFYQGERDTIQIDKVDLQTGEIIRWKNYVGLSSDKFSTNKIRDIQHFNATPWESCQRYIDLDVDNSTALGKDFFIDSICSFSNIPLSDFDIRINNEYPIDSIDIFILDPRFSQYLFFPDGNYNLMTSPNFFQRIINNGTTSIGDFEDAIRNAYLNIEGDSSATDIKILFKIWYNGIAGDTAIATIKIAGPLPNAGTDITQTYCEGDTALTLIRLPSNEADLGGTFYDANFNIITNLETSVAPYDAVIYYEATNGICYDTSQIDLSVRPIPTLVGLEDIVTCFDNEYKTEINVDNNSSLIWSDGNPDPMRILTDAGTYAYQITNQYGCIASDTFTLTKLPPSTSMTTDVQICDGETFTYMDKKYDVQGNYIDTIMNVYGCDSVIFILNLGVYPFIPISLTGDLSFCDGNSTSISIESPHNLLMLDEVKVSSPITLTESGDFLITGTDQNGCITEKEIYITMHPNPEVLTFDMIDTVFVKGLELSVSYDGDIETYSWSPITALDCADCPYPTLLTPSEGIYTIAIEDKNGCKNEAQLRVTFLDTKLYLPNVISNHTTDPENEVFYIKGNNSQLYSLSVYDRWGNLIFHRKDAEVNNRDDGWSPRGKVASGVYVYLINYKENGESKTLYGSITVLD